MTIIFLSISLNVCFGCSKEPSHICFGWEIRKIFSVMLSYLEACFIRVHFLSMCILSDRALASICASTTFDRAFFGRQQWILNYSLYPSFFGLHTQCIHNKCMNSGFWIIVYTQMYLGLHSLCLISALAFHLMFKCNPQPGALWGPKSVHIKCAYCKL